MIYLQAEGLSKSFGERTLFSGLNISISQGQKIALIARNGTGKSTLLKILAGLDTPDEGSVMVPDNIRVGFLSQNPEMNPQNTIFDEAVSGENVMTNALKNYHHAMETGKNLQKAMDEMEAAGAWDYESKVEEVLSRLELQEHDKKISHLSGGQKKRLSLAQLLLKDPDLIIMDEPTNHLDLQMVEWLEDFLSSRNTTILLVTHDRYFLDNVTNEILELENGKIYKYSGNYSYFIEKKAEREEVFQTTTQKAKKLYKTELNWLRRMPKARGTKAKYRIKAADDLKDKASQKLNRDKVALDIKTTRLGKKILELHNVAKSFGEKVIITNFNYKFKRSEKIGIAGKNGTGKTTFLRLLTGELEPDKGKIVHGETLNVGFFRQEDPGFDPEKRVIEVVRDIAEVILLNDGQKLSASQMLERFLFSRDEQYVHVAKLSGGERRRLHLLTVLMRNPNFLILDEPTNDLDILTLTVLEDFLENFHGCLVVVTHDRFFLDKVVDHLFIFRGEGKIKDFNGSYYEFLDSEKQEELKLREAKKRQLPEKTSTQKEKSQPAKNKLSFNEKRELESLEKEIEKLNLEKAELEKSLETTLDHEKLSAVGIKIGEISSLIDEKEMRWLELSERT